MAKQHVDNKNMIGRFAVPLLFWVIIGPIAALLSWLFLRKKNTRI